MRWVIRWPIVTRGTAEAPTDRVGPGGPIGTNCYLTDAGIIASWITLASPVDCRWSVCRRMPASPWPRAG